MSPLPAVAQLEPGLLHQQLWLAEEGRGSGCRMMQLLIGRGSLEEFLPKTEPKKKQFERLKVLMQGAEGPGSP